ncbi:LytR/AlgR family response regulator transcription factor [Microbulbifer sp. JMSA008]|uniref:LytR/AlgR family response regulator transcription factor n=2 Tax=Microbulbifer TaxID=48073 RepID=UPI0040390582
MTLCTATALVADDEPLLRQALIRKLAAQWPELEVVAEARNGREAIELFELHQPDICFLDIQMPGISGVEAAQEIGRRAHLVFITAYDQYAVKAFQQEALDYLVKPVENDRLANTVSRLQERLQMTSSVRNSLQSLEQITEQFQKTQPSNYLRWIKASIGNTLRLIAVEDIHYLRSDEKYTLIAWSESHGKTSEALIKTPLKDLSAQLDPQHFVQVHRSVVVNFKAIQHVIRDGDTAQIHLKYCQEVLPVSRRFMHLFKQM